MDKINAITHCTRSKKVEINLASSSIADPQAMMIAASHLSNTCYTRYGSTVDFYIPANKVEYWVNRAKAHGLDVVS